jgi:CubicO group peptidase (beta-lactamase class C family)
MVDELARLVDRSAIGSEVPLVIAVHNGAGRMESIARGRWPDGRLVRPTDRFYAASLAKQVTGAAAALLVREGRLDPDLPIARYLPDLPGWADEITARHLTHHTSGLPGAGDAEPTGADWTNAFVLKVLGRLPKFIFTPGSAYLYSNLGYVLLAWIIARVAGCSLPRFTATRLLEPLGLEEMGFVEGGNLDFPQASMMGPSLPLTVGDGGLWTTAAAFSRWLHHQNRDTLGIAHIVAQPGELNGGGQVAYGWGLGLRQHKGHPLLIHGGEWIGCTAKAVRSPSRGSAIVALSAGASQEDLSALVESVLDR